MHTFIADLSATYPCIGEVQPFAPHYRARDPLEPLQAAVMTQEMGDEPSGMEIRRAACAPFLVAAEAHLAERLTDALTGVSPGGGHSVHEPYAFYRSGERWQDVELPASFKTKRSQTIRARARCLLAVVSTGAGLPEQSSARVGVRRD